MEDMLIVQLNSSNRRSSTRTAIATTSKASIRRKSYPESVTNIMSSYTSYSISINNQSVLIKRQVSYYLLT